MSVPAPVSSPVIDVDSAGFDHQVVEASTRTPVLVDFWAAWCGPCKALTPVLERLAVEFDGAFVLAKVDTDANRELAARHGIRSLPTVRLFVGGTAVAEFSGAHPESAVRAFLGQHLPRPVDTTGLDAVTRRLDDGDAEGARAALEALDTDSRESDAGRALAARVGFLESTRELPETAALAAALAADPADPDALFALGVHHAAAGRHDEALDLLLALIARNRGYRDGAARETVLRIFDALGSGDPRVPAWRSRLASALN